jgi:hypothetical protein
MRTAAQRNTIMKNTFSRAILQIALASLYSGLAVHSVRAQVAVNAVTHDTSSAGAVYYTGQYAANRQIGEMQLTLSTATIPADGQSSLTVDLIVTDRKGNPVAGELLLTLETSAGRILLNGARTDELGPGALDADKVVPGTQIKVTNGKASFKVIAPSMPQEGIVRVTGGSVFAERKVSFVPEQRDLMALGLLEGTIALRRVKNESAVSSLRTNDGFDDALRRFEREFNSSSNGLSTKTTTGSARVAFFVKGTITGQTLLTAAYDSDKETRARMLRDITVDQVYPVFGDASIKGYDAKSSQRFYIRLDNGKNYLLYGDFQTSDGFSQSSGTGAVASVKQRDLSSNGRTMTGVRAHLEADGQDASALKGSYLNVYASRDSLNNIVIERKGNGLSFYQIDHASAIENTEKLEVVVRDRNNPGRVLSVLALQRYADYTFEPFNGRIILGAPLQSTDNQGNPQSLRIGYEVDQGGDKYWVAGLDGQVKLGEYAEIGGSYLQDKNPQAPTIKGERKLSQLASVNVGVNVANNVKAVVELAQSKNMTSVGEQTGTAVRAEVAMGKTGDTVSGVAFLAKADKDFYNANASVNLGRQEIGVKAAVKAADALTVRAEVLASKDETVNADRKGAFLGADFAVSEGITVSAGVRKAKDNGSGLYGPTTAASNTTLYGTGGLFGTTTGTSPGSQIQQVGTATGAALDTTTVQLGVKGKVSPTITLGLEGETGKSNATSNATTVSSANTSDKVNRLAATAEWQVAERTKLSARYETQTGIGSTYDRADRNNAFVLGVSNTYLNSGLGQGNGGVQGELFSEYRLRDAIGGRESQLASGLRNTFDISEGLRGVAGVEYFKSISGSTQPTLAMATGLDYTASELWKGSTRLEWRKAQATLGLNPVAGNVGIMNTVSVARKLDRNWTALARNYYATTDVQNVAGKQMQNRFTVGFAYRPVDADRFDALGKLEYKIENNGEVANTAGVAAESRKALVVSISSNWHPSRNWWLSGRFAAKTASEAYNANNGSGLMSTDSKFSATMMSARAMYDVTSRWDLGALASLMQGGGNRQYAYGLETGFVVKRNLWLSAGYNFAGFTDKDLTGNEYTAKGPYLRLRAKFNENLFGSDDSTVVTK